VACLAMLAGAPCAQQRQTKNLLFLQADGPYPVGVSGKMGFIDRKGKMVIEPRFEVERLIENGSFFYEGRALIERDNKKGFIDETGNMIIAARFDDAAPFSEGMASVAINGKYGFIDKTGNIVIKPQFDN